jgi:hypothetical protein
MTSTRGTNFPHQRISNNVPDTVGAAVISVSERTSCAPAARGGGPGPVGGPQAAEELRRCAQRSRVRQQISS